MTAEALYAVVALAAMTILVLAATLGHATRELRRAREAQRSAELKVIEMALADAEKTAALYERILERKKDDTASIIESAVRMATTGTTEPPSALVQSPEPDAEQILRSRVVEETIQNGMVRLREEYVRAGVDVPSDDVLREEVELMLGGELPASAMAGAVRQ